MLKLIVDQLTDMGYTVYHACDGKFALDVLDRIPAIEARRRPALPVLYASDYTAATLKKKG